MYNNINISFAFSNLIQQVFVKSVKTNVGF
jgi:hypothetical protein